MIRFSFFDYDLTDLASEYSLFTLELAIRKRYEELEGDDPGDKGLDWLIKWGCRTCLFEPSDEHMLALKSARNFAAHPRRYSLLGPLAFDPIIFVVSVVNGMYHDPILRRKRKSETERVNLILEEAVREGALLRKGPSVVRIFKAFLLYFDNRHRQNVYHFAFWPMFELPAGQSVSVSEGEPIMMQGSDLVVHADTISITTTKHAEPKMTIGRSDDPCEVRFLRDWVQNLRDNYPAVAASVEFTLGIARSNFEMDLYSVKDTEA